MAQTFLLSIMTPENEFFEGQVEALTVTATDGEIGILAGHLPLVAPIVDGEIKLKVGGEWKNAFCSEGFIEVIGERARVFVQECEWPVNIDINRALRTVEAERERLRQKQSIAEYTESKIALSRAMARLRITKQSINLQ